MANVSDINDVSSIWGVERTSKITKRRVIGAGAFLVVTALAIGLYFGLEGSDEESDAISGQAAYSNEEGCYADLNGARVMENRIDFTSSLTPEVCSQHCLDLGYDYYGLQYSVECWCGYEGDDFSVHGAGTCDMPCSGDSDLSCGGDWSILVYQIGIFPSIQTTSQSDTTYASTCSGTIASVRFASTSKIAYFEGEGCATLTDLYNAQISDGQDDGPLFVLDDDDVVVDSAPTGRWLLTWNLRVTLDATLYVHSIAEGGDCDVLRIQSTDDAYWNLRGHGGSLSFLDTTVTSWDTDNGQEREWSDGVGRSYINCVTQFDDSALWTCTGASDEEYGTCTMDIVNSVMGNLGWFDSESYGLTWKVRGMCSETDETTGFPVNHEIFEDHNVYGDILNSEIYGMYYGHYTYGHEGGVWTDNIMRDNIQYGFDPHDDSDNLVISRNEVYGNGNHGIIASKRCNNVEITDNVIYDGGEEAVGIFLHRSSDDAVVTGNKISNMQDAGIAIMESAGALITGNTIENTKYGIRLSVSSSDNTIHDNYFSTMSDYGIYTYMGSDDPFIPGNDGRNTGNSFTSNVIENVEHGVNIEEGDDNTFDSNTFTGVDDFLFDDANGNIWTNNDIGSACLEASDSSFASGSDAIPGC